MKEENRVFCQHRYVGIGIATITAQGFCGDTVICFEIITCQKCHEAGG